MYEGYSATCIRRLLESDAGWSHSSKRSYSQLNVSLDTVCAKVHELSAARLETLHLPPEVDRVRKLEELEAQMRDVTYEVAVGLCTRMDSAPFLRFFGVRFISLPPT